MVMREVHEQIDLHRRQFSRQSYLQRAVNSVYNPSAQTLHELIITQEELDRDHGRSFESVDARRGKAIEQQIQSDREAQVHELTVAAVAATKP